MSRVLTAERVAAAYAAGQRQIHAPPGAVVITPDAWSKARELGVVLVRGSETKPTVSGVQSSGGNTTTPAPQPDKGSVERDVDPSGIVVARGRTVRLGAFAGAGTDRHVGLLDVISGADRSPMTAGIMSWSRDDSFPWSLDYDEIDYVLEGVLEIGVAGRSVTARPGDVLYLPKGSTIVFGTPSRVRVFYVTYPAEWMGAQRTP